MTTRTRTAFALTLVGVVLLAPEIPNEPFSYVLANEFAFRNRWLRFQPLRSDVREPVGALHSVTECYRYYAVVLAALNQRRQLDTDLIVAGIDTHHVTVRQIEFLRDSGTRQMPAPNKIQKSEQTTRNSDQT